MTIKKEIYPITGVALGPGDPDLITLKGLRTLESADVIYYAASKITGDVIESFSKQILEAYKLKVVSKPLLFPMSGKRRNEFYEKAFNVLVADQQQGLKVVMVTEGDLGFYSTFGYLLKLAKERNTPIQAIPGVPAFIAGGAAAEWPIADGNHGFINLARPASFDAIQKEISSGKAVVVMKMKVLNGWYEFLKQVERLFIYVEKVGTSNEYITSNYNDLEEREIPYFALIIFPGIE